MYMHTDRSGQQRPGGAGSNHSQKNTPGLHPFQFVAKAGWQAGRSAQGDPPTPASLIQSAAHSKIRAQAIPLFCSPNFSLSSSPIQNCTALTQHNTHPLTPSLPPNPNPTQVSTSYFFVITAKSKVLLVSAATRLALFPGPPLDHQRPFAPSPLVASSQARCRLSLPLTSGSTQSLPFCWTVTAHDPKSRC